MFVLLLLAVGILAPISLIKIYYRVPVAELKRQAKAGDKLAQVLHRAASYEDSLEVMLWMVIALFGSIFVVVAANSLPTILALLVCFLVIWFGFAWLPKSHISFLGIKITEFITPGLAWMLQYLQPVLSRLADIMKRFRPITVHTGIFNKQDLLSLINQQKNQIDNRIHNEELEIAANALMYGDKKVSDIMTPRRVLKTVSAHEIIGPILMDELHKQGHSRFPVYQDDQNNIIGTLYLQDLMSAKAGGFVKSIMNKRVYYVHEEQPLFEVLHVFLKSKHHLAVVVNSFEEIVGIVTLEDVLEQILGKLIVDEFDRYDDLRAVAALKAEKEHKSHETVVKSSETTPKEDKQDDQSSRK